jgi:Cof subfamily protein (haloacid dehalogenase superfamily)
MDIRLFALDLDGTILVDPHKLDEELSEILKLLSLKGDIILFNTGRTFAYSRHIFKRLDFTFYSGFSNGVALASFPSREIIYEASLPAELLFETRRLFKKHRIDPIFQGGMRNNDTTVFESLQYPSKELLEIFGEESDRRIEVESLDRDNIRDFVSVFGCSKNRSGIMDLSEELNTIEGLYSVAFIHSYNEESYWITVSSDSMNKGVPVRKIADRYGLGKSRIYAFGNDRNDLPMLLEAGHPVSVADAPEEVRSMAEEIVETPDRGGVLNYLKALI